MDAIFEARRGMDKWDWLRKLVPGKWSSLDGGFLVGWGTITPPAAAIILAERNSENRPISKRVVQKLSRTMKNNLWLLNGEAIVFDDSPTLRQGQHRLQACCDSGVPFDTFVICGVSSHSFHTYDQHSKRTLAQYLASQGKPNPKTLASAIPIVYTFSNYGMIARPGGYGDVIVMDDFLNTLAEHPGLEDSAAFVQGVGNSVKVFRGAGSVIAMHYIFSRANADLATQLFESMCSMSISPSDEWFGARLLAKKLLESQANKSTVKGAISHETIAALTVKVWNSIFQKVPLRKLVYLPTEEFPMVAGWNYVDGVPTLQESNLVNGMA